MAAPYLLVEGHEEGNETLLLVFAREIGRYGHRLKHDITHLWLNQLLCKDQLLSRAHNGVARHWKAIFILECLATVESRFLQGTFKVCKRLTSAKPWKRKCTLGATWCIVNNFEEPFVLVFSKRTKCDTPLHLEK